MNNEILFSESQKFRQWWLWLILLSVNGLFIFGVIKQVILGQQFGDDPMSDTGILLVTGLSLLFAVILITSRLDTVIKRDGIYARFFPFHFRYRFYAWETLTKSYVRQYSALSEYGGWGLRLGFFGSGKAYNVSGDKGLQLEFKDNKKLLIGTKRPEELASTLSAIGHLKD